MKKYRYPLLVFLLILFNIGVYLKNQDCYLLEEYAVSIHNQEKKMEIRDDSKYKIRIYYPNTEYGLLNETIEDKMKQYVVDFKNNLDDSFQSSDSFYTLDITYDTYHYKDYFSYVFYIFFDVGGAHPSSLIWTICYDTKKDEILTLDNISSTYPNILQFFSQQVQNQLKTNERISDMGWMLEGTKPIPENYQNFVFSKNGIFVFFPPYQIAPYSSGTFQLLVPYDKIF